MKLADLESREVLLAKLAGAMKGSLAKAARTFDALRIKMEAGAPAPVAVSEPKTVEVVAEVPAQAETTEAVVETPAETNDVVAEVAAEATDAPVAEATETPAE
jgi:large subunit ribosomal protein L10